MKNKIEFNEIPPIFTEKLRNEILNYTDNKEHKTFIKVLDSPTTNKLIMGAKNVSKSFGVMIDTIFRIVNEPDYCAVWARNLSTDIANTIHPCFIKALDFLKVVHNLDFTPFFEIYAKVVVYKPTQQAIFFANFELVNSFAGLTLKKTNFDICDVVFDEIQQNPDELGNQLEKIYSKQPADMNFIKQSTILRTKRKPNQKRRMIFLFNIYDSKHWVCIKYVVPLLPFSKENREKLVKQTYLYAEDLDLDASVMRMSRFYVPSSEIDEYQMKEYDALKKENPKLYDITIAGEPYDNQSSTIIYPFIDFIYDDNNQINEHLIFNYEIDKFDFLMIIDGFDPGLKDNNGYCRIGVTPNYELVIIDAEEIKSSEFSNYKRFTSLEHILSRIVSLNEFMGLKNSILAIDSKEDTLIEMATKFIAEYNLNIVPVKAIKNKNPNFQIDFNISNRYTFFKQCFERQIIKFTPQSTKLLEYISMQAFSNDGKRDEKINPKIYDLINAMEYATSIIYQLIILNNIMENNND